MYTLQFFLVKLNGGRNVIGILRGFDPFMNIVLDETVENTKSGEQNNIGMVVSTPCLTQYFLFIYFV